jgi:predicted aconitase with swiveling domain
VRRGGDEEELKLVGRTIFDGRAAGEALVSASAVSFYGGVDPESGEVIERGHELQGKTVKGKVLVFPHGKGSTVGSYVLYRLAKNGAAPRAIINANCETIVAVGAIISEIPCVDRIDIGKIRTGARVSVDGSTVLFENPG